MDKEKIKQEYIRGKEALIKISRDFDLNVENSIQGYNAGFLSGLVTMGVDINEAFNIMQEVL